MSSDGLGDKLPVAGKTGVLVNSWRGLGMFIMMSVRVSV